MKILYLARHADASPGDPPTGDFHRPLSARGLRDAPAMGRLIAGIGPPPEVIVASPAVRALTTARLFAGELGLPATAVVESKALYAASAETILDAVNELDDAHACAMVVGHNPGMTLLAGELSRGGISHMPGCSVASFELPVDAWAVVRPGRGRLRFFETPKGQRK